MLILSQYSGVSTAVMPVEFHKKAEAPKRGPPFVQEEDSPTSW